MSFIIIQRFNVLLKANWIIGLNIEFETLYGVEHNGIEKVEGIDYIVYSIKYADNANAIVNKIIATLDETIKELKSDNPDYP